MAHSYVNVSVDKLQQLCDACLDRIKVAREQAWVSVIQRHKKSLLYRLRARLNGQPEADITIIAKIRKGVAASGWNIGCPDFHYVWEENRANHLKKLANLASDNIVTVSAEDLDTIGAI